MIATTNPPDTLLDMLAGQGQFQCSFRFFLFDFPTGAVVREVFPARDPAPQLTHDVTRTIVRQLENVYFPPGENGVINPIRQRIVLYMVIPGRAPYLLGTFMFLDQERFLSTEGISSSATLVDSMFIVDQQFEQSYAAGTFNPDGSVITFRQCDAAIGDILTGLPITYTAEPTPYYTIGVWSAGENKGGALEDISIDGDYFSPWFDNTNTMRFIRTFDPATVIPQFDFDTGYRVNRESITYTNDLIQAPNRFVVISNGSVSDGVLPVVGQYDVPSSAPHSITNRGFVIPQVIDWQVDYASQANAIAANFGQRQTIYERVEFTTPPDPRHDAYDVFRFQGVNWLELAWSMPLTAGSEMTHIGRKAYS